MTVTVQVVGRVEPRPAPAARRRRGGSRLKDAVLWVGAILGVAGLAWMIVAPLLALSVVTFKTGSMSPSIPAGAAAVVQLVPASDLRVGDVVTVARRAESLPVTHRIVEISVGAAGERVLVLKGDANDRPDALPYEVSEARRVVASLPVVGTAFVVAQTPLFLGAGTLLVAVLVFWAFWPEKGAHRA